MSVPAHSNPIRGYVIALTSAAVLSTSAVFIRHLTLSYGIPVLVLALWRNVFVASALLAGLSFLRPGLLRIDPTHRGLLAIYGLTLALFNVLWTLSVAQNGAAIATVLVYCSAAFTALLGRWLLQERLDAAKMVVVGLSLGGCALVAGALDTAALQLSPLGIVAGLLSGLGFSAYSLLGRTASQRGINPWTTLLYAFGLAGFVLLWINLLAVGTWPGVAAQTQNLSLGSEPAAWLILFLLALGPTIGGFGLYNISLGDLPSSVANLILTAEPAFTATVAFFVLGERLTVQQIAGSVMILSAVAFLSLHERRLGQEARRRLVRDVGSPTLK